MVTIAAQMPKENCKNGLNSSAHANYTSHLNTLARTHLNKMEVYGWHVIT